MMHCFSTRTLRVVLLAAILLGAGSLAAVPLTLKYQVKDLGTGTYQYDFVLVVDNNDMTYQPGQAWRWLIFGDHATSSPLTAWQISSGQLPVGPWTGMSSSGGGHNGPTFSYVLDYWTPTGIGDALHWRGTSTANLPQGQLLWSTLAGTLNGGVAANFTVAERVDPGLYVDATKGTAASVLNNENGGGIGYQAATFRILNNGNASDDISSITIEGLGTGDHGTAYTSFQLYRDQTASGTVGSYDAGDVLIGSGTFSGGPPQATISVPVSEQTFAPAADKRFFIVVQLNGTAITAQTFKYKVAALATGASATIFNVPSRTMEGLVINGPAVTVSAVVGTAEPVQNNETGGGIGFEAGRFTVTANAFSSVTLNSLTIRGSGTGDHLNDYAEFAVYRDQTASGTVGSYDAGDALISTATFAGSPAEATIPFSGGEATFAASETKTYFIVIKLGGTASVTETFNYAVQAGSSAGTSAVLGVPSATILGVYIIAPEVTFDGKTVYAPGVVPSGITDHVVQSFSLTASSVANQDINSITLTRTGTISDTDITAVKLWDDANGNGFVDTGETQLGSTQTFSGGTLTISGSPLNSLTSSQTRSYVVTYSLGTGINNGTTFGATLSPASDISATPGPVRVTTALVTTTHTVYLVASFPWTDNLETLALDSSNPVPLTNGWWNDTSDGTNDWYVDNNGTPTGGTGPATDHNPGTTSGRYIYFEDSNSYTAEQRMRTPPFDISALSLPAFRFWLHSVNASTTAGPNILHVDLVDVMSKTITNDIITALQANSGWTEHVVDLSSVTVGIVQLQFRIQSHGSSTSHDVALDDFSLSDSPDMNVKNNATSASVSNGGTDAIGGVMTVGQNFTWDIENLGGVNLNLTGTPLVAVNPVSNVNVSVTTNPTSPIAAAGTSSFVVNVAPQAAGAFSFTVSIANNDPDENPYTFTVTGTGVANTPPSVTIPTGSNWVNNGGNYELTLNPGAAYNDDLEIDDPTPDDMTVTVTPSGATPTTITSAPASIATPTAGPITLNWTGTADASNTPGSYTWQISVNDGINTVNFTASIIILDLAPTHAIGVDAGAGTGQTSGTAYTGQALVGSVAALTLADVDDPNTGQNPALGTVTPDAGNPAGGSGFNISLVAGSIVATPTAALQLADLGTHVFEVDVTDGTNTTTLFVAVEVVTPEIDVLNATATAIPVGGSDTVTGAQTGQALPITYTIENNGSAELNITTVVISNTVNCAASVTSNPGSPVAVAGSTTFTVSVTPTVPGAFSFDISINNDDVNENPYDFSVNGTAAGAPDIEVSDAASTVIPDGGTDNLGTRNTGQATLVTYTVANTGNVDLNITGVNTSATVNCTVSLSAAPAATVAPGTSTTFTVSVTPTADGLFSFAIAITSDDPDENPYDINVSGTAALGGVSGGGGGGGGGGGCVAGDSSTPLFALLALALVSLVAIRRRRA